MNIKVLSAALGVALSTVAISAKAQKVYTEGYASYTGEMRGQPTEVKSYFSPDSAAQVITFGAGTVKILTAATHNYLAVVLDIPIAGMKKAGIATPAELEAFAGTYPALTFTPGTETKVISGFNCKKVVATDSKSGKTFDVWITNDITVPPTAIPFYYKGVGGYPIQYTAFQQGQETSVTITSITPGKAPKGTFSVPSDFDKVTMDDLNSGQ